MGGRSWPRLKEEDMGSKARTFSVAAAGALALMLAAFGGTAVAKDRNHDHISDKWEKKFHLSLKVDQSNRDRDKVDNLNEFQEGTNPRDRDSDNDGRPDGREDSDHDGLNNMGEDETSNLPDDQDTDNDGVRDGEENAGTIATFDGTTLTIDLAGGGQVSGMVDSTTRIECENEDEHEAGDNSGPGNAHSSHDGGSETGDDNGRHDENGPGDDQGDDNERPCTTADLTPGTAVHEAELEGTTFAEVELVK
jgi:hypothetical protein